MEKATSFNAILQQTIRDNWNRYSLSDYGENHFQYKDVARIIEKIHIVFKKLSQDECDPALSFSAVPKDDHHDLRPVGRDQYIAHEFLQRRDIFRVEQFV